MAAISECHVKEGETTTFHLDFHTEELTVRITDEHGVPWGQQVI